MRDPDCQSYEECLREAARLNIDFNCKKCKKRGQDPSAKEPEKPSRPTMFTTGGFRKTNNCLNECVRCRWRQTCRNAKPKCFESRYAPNQELPQSVPS